MPLPEPSINRAASHLRDVLSLAIQHSHHNQALIVFDNQSQLAKTLTRAYQLAIPYAKFIHFDSTTPEYIKAEFSKLQANDLVVLIQSDSFRLDAFRIRVELFKKSLKVIEHPHLARMQDIQAEYYIDALAYNPHYYHHVGNKLKQLIDNASRAIINSSELLFFNSPLESAKLNIGDYSHLPNIGGQFPIGEVFTEAKDLEAVSGKVRIFAFGDTDFSVKKVDTPITLIINKGKVIDTENSIPAFDQVLNNIRADEGDVWLRELGFGLNQAFTQERIVNDIGTYERMCGIHLSLGAKHGLYNKPNFKRAQTWHHVDVFAVTESVILDNIIVYKDEKWII